MPSFIIYVIETDLTGSISINLQVSIVLCCNIFVFVDNVQALKDVWLLGDYFLGEIFPSLQAMLAQARQQKKSPPYLY